jgi:hypothetical protein
MSLSFPPKAHGRARFVGPFPAPYSSWPSFARFYLFGALLGFVALSLLLVSSVGMDTLSATRAYATGRGSGPSGRRKRRAS